MAFAISLPITRTPFFGIDSPYFEGRLADQVTTTANQNCQVPCRYFSAFIYIKSYTIGSATVGPIFTLTAGADPLLITNQTTLNNHTATNTATNNTLQTVVMNGIAPTAPGLQYFQLSVTLNGSSTIVYDCILNANP